MENQVLSIEQMRHLKELGVDTSKESMCWFISNERGRENKYISVFDDQMEEAADYPYYEVIPVFTLQDIIELLPKRLETKDKKEGELLMFYDSYMKTGWNVCYTDYFDDIIQDFKLIDALYKLLCWVAENGYLKGSEK